MTNDIICAKCGKHFNNIDSARNHQEHCTESEGAQIYFIPSITIITASEIKEALKSQSGNKNIVTNYCPLKKAEASFPCPRCIHSESESEMKEFFKTTTWWYCKYPEIVNPTIKMRMLREKESDPHLKQLSKVVWDCPSCKKYETVRYDMQKKVFICWECCKIVSLEEGKQLFDGFEWDNNII